MSEEEIRGRESEAEKIAEGAADVMLHRRTKETPIQVSMKIQETVE